MTLLKPKMVMNKVMAFLFVYIVMALCSGCSRQGAGNENCGELESAAVSNVLVRIDSLSKRIETGQFSRQDYFHDLKERIEDLPHNEKGQVVEELELDKFKPNLKGLPFRERQSRLDVFMDTTRQLAFIIVDNTSEKEKVWNFLYKTIEFIKNERAAVSEREDDELLPAMGFHVTKKMYLRDLDSKLFYSVRQIFEEGPFWGFYAELDKSSKQAWIDRLEKLSGRSVQIVDPRGFHEGLSRFDFKGN